MIHDGYTEALNLGSGTLIFRPMIQSERDELLRLMRQCDGVTKSVLLHTITSAHVVQNTTDAHVDKLEAIVLSAEQASQEREDEANLARGVSLLRDYPHLATDQMDCSKCRAYCYDPWAGKLLRQYGEPIPRPEGDRLVCETHLGCPLGHYEDPFRLSAKNATALKHYHECVATGNFPDDAIVRRNARIIREALDGGGLDQRSRANSGGIQPRVPASRAPAPAGGPV